MQKGYKFRIYPNKEQQELIHKTLGCVRYVYNHFLADAKSARYESYNKNSKKLTALKKELPFLKEVDATALQNSLKNLDCAFSKLFDGGAKYPRFKRKHSNYKSYTSQNNGKNIRIEDNTIRIPKLGFVRAKIHRPVKGKILKATVQLNPSGKYFTSLCVEIDEPSPKEKVNSTIGVDLGLKEYASLSTGEKVLNPKHLTKYEKKLAKLQRQLSRKKKGSKNRNKARLKIAKLHEKIKNIRNDFLHKLSRRLVDENQFIVVESLKVKNMLKNKHLAKHISDASWGTFVRFLSYKAEWAGRTLIKVDTFFPSSQLCSECDYQNPEVKDLSVLKWRCPSCGQLHDRNINAAKNIKKEGLRQIA